MFFSSIDYNLNFLKLNSLSGWRGFSKLKKEKARDYFAIINTIFSKIVNPYTNFSFYF